jgi:hypothetical protein
MKEKRNIKEELKMFIVYDPKGVHYARVGNEMEADYIAYCIGGYYK